MAIESFYIPSFIFINTETKTQQIKELKQSKLQLEIKKDSAQIELDRIDL